MDVIFVTCYFFGGRRPSFGSWHAHMPTCKHAHIPDDVIPFIIYIGGARLYLYLDDLVSGGFLLTDSTNRETP